MMILRKQILVCRWKTNGFFIIQNIRKRIYIKRFNEFAFMVVSFNLLSIFMYEYVSSCTTRADVSLRYFYKSAEYKIIITSNIQLLVNLRLGTSFCNERITSSADNFRLFTVISRFKIFPDSTEGELWRSNGDRNPWFSSRRFLFSL